MVVGEITQTVCAGCGHSLACHFRDVTGVVRCLWRRDGVTTSGVLGMQYAETCDCCDFTSKQAEAREAERKKEEEEKRQELCDAFLEKKRGTLPTA